MRDNLRLTDFGIATALDGRAGADTEQALIQGTGGFIAPEHLAGESATPAGDVYGLGAVARALLDAAEDVHDRAPEVQAVLSRALASKPSDRFGTAREFVSELASALVPESATTQVFHGAATQVFAQPTRVFPQPPPEVKPLVKTSPLLPVVAVERAVRAALLLGVGLVALLLRNHPEFSIRHTALRLDLALNPLQHAYDLVFGTVPRATPHDFAVLGIVALAFGGLHGVEAIGLACRLRAAVYLTVTTTIGLIPVEVWWLSHHPGRMKEIALAVNAAVAVSLCGTLLRARFAARRAVGAAVASRAPV